MSKAFDEAVQAIIAGKAEPNALWVLLSEEHSRDGFWLKPLLWEGPGEYQHVSYHDGREGFVRVPEFAFSLRDAVERLARRAKWAAQRRAAGRRRDAC